MGTKRQAVWVGSTSLIMTFIIAVVSYYIGYKQNQAVQNNNLLLLEEKVNKALFDNFKQGISPSRNQIFMTMRSVARKQGVGKLDTTSLNRVVENVTARIFQDSTLVSEQKKALLNQAASLAIISPVNDFPDSPKVGNKAQVFWGFLIVATLVIGLPCTIVFLFYFAGPNRVTQSSLGSFVETLIKYLYSRYENDLAISLVEENLVQSPKNPILYAYKSRLLTRLGRNEEALRSIDQGLEICSASSKPILLRTRAICLCRLGRHEEAIEVLIKSRKGFWGIIRTFFERSDFLRTKVEVIGSNGSPDEAMTESNRLVARYPHSPHTFAVRANILRKTGYVEDSLLAAERAIELSRGQADPSRDTRTTGLLAVAAAYSMMERFEESFELLVQHLPHVTSSLHAIENIYGFEKLLKDNIYGKKIKDMFRDSRNTHVEVGERNYFL